MVVSCVIDLPEKGPASTSSLTGPLLSTFMGMSNGLHMETEHLSTTATSALQTEAARYYGKNSNKSHLNLAPSNNNQAQNQQKRKIVVNCYSSCNCTVANLNSVVFDTYTK
jgi:hypothetical protein